MTFELVIPDHLSRSQLDTYSDCGTKWLLQRGLSVPQTPAWALIGGSTVHEVTEVYDRALMQGEILDDEELRQEFDRTLESNTAAEEERYAIPRAQFRASGRASKEWPDKETEAWWRKKGPEFVLAWKSWRNVTPWDLVPLVAADGSEHDPIELTFKLTLAEGLETWGAIDRVFTYQGHLIVVDLKTGSYAPKKPDQLGDYSTAVEELLGVRPKWGYYWMARQGGVLDSEDLTKERFTKPEMAKQYGMVQRGIQAGIFLANVGMMCGSCSVRDYCRAVDGVKSAQVQV